MADIPRERYAWYKEGVPDWDCSSQEGLFKLVKPAKYLKADESPFCRCGHHVKDHGYSCIFDDEYFCFAVKNPECRACPCTGFEPYKTKPMEPAKWP